MLLASGSHTMGSGREVVWKSSVLPFLFYGLDDQQRQNDPHLNPQRELYGAAKTLNTQFWGQWMAVLHLGAGEGIEIRIHLASIIYAKNGLTHPKVYRFCFQIPSK